MDDEVFHFEDDDDYQTSNDGYDDVTENQPWERRNKGSIVLQEQVFKDIPADQFLSQIDLSSGPTVKILLSSPGNSKQQVLTLPKALLCTRSPFFNRIFNGNTKDTQPPSQEVHLPETSLTTFQLLIQYLHTNTFTFPAIITNTSDKLTLYLRFFISCHQFSITNLTPILHSFKSLLKLRSHHGEFPSHSQMKQAVTLPPTHEARKFCIAACVKPYAYSITKSSTCYGRALFHLEEFMYESNEFAAELLRGYTKAVRGALGNHTIVDPLTGGAYVITTGVACRVERSSLRENRCLYHLEGA